jgi:LPXTG-motif cell wall-anchored protein
LVIGSLAVLMIVPTAQAQQRGTTPPPNTAPAPAPAAPATQPATPAEVAPISVGPAPVQLPAALPRTGDVPDAAPLLIAGGLALMGAGAGLRRRFPRG